MFTHIVPNRALDAAALRAVPAVTPLSNSTIFVGAGVPHGSSPSSLRNVPISLVSAGATAQITQPDDFVGCNYVLHKIDAVLRSSPSATGGINPAYTQALATGRAPTG